MRSQIAPLPAEINSLHVWSGLRIELFWIYEGQVHPLNRQRETDHSQGHYVWFLQRGSVQVRQGKKVLRAKAGDCLVSPRGLMQQSFSKDAHILSIHFGCEWPTGDGLFVERSGCVFRSKDHPDLINAGQALADYVTTFSPAPADAHFSEHPLTYFAFLKLQGYVTEWLHVFAQTLLNLGYSFTKIGSIDERLLSAVRCLKETPLNGSFPAQLIQSETGLGRSQLERLFFQAFGLSTRNYWNNRRLDSAKALLATQNSPIKEVGFRLGFKQASHFTSWFTERAGLSPIAYRKRERFDDHPRTG